MIRETPVMEVGQLFCKVCKLANYMASATVIHVIVIRIRAGYVEDQELRSNVHKVEARAPKGLHHLVPILMGVKNQEIGWSAEPHQHFA